MQLVCVAWGFFCENKFKVNLKSNDCQGNINQRRKRGKMINEENKYLAQSDESDSEYREKQKKEER